MAHGGKVNTTPNPPRAYVPPELDGPHVHNDCVDLFDVLLYVVGAWGIGLLVGLTIAGY